MVRPFDRPGRSVVHAGEAMAATSHPLATAACLDVLRRGGSAVDAAIAASAVLAVVEPAETGIGGDCFALVAPDGATPPVAFNGSGRSPLAASAERLPDDMGEIPDQSVHSVTVPGAVDAWTQLHRRFGRLDFAALLQPAIRYARDGYVVHERVADEWRHSADRLRGDPEAARLFLRDGAAPATGSIMRNLPLAETLQRIAEAGRAGFYEGAVAEAMVEYLRTLGGLHTAEDFASTRGDFVDPISARFRGSDVWQLPPNAQGVIALLMLRLIERLAPSPEGFGSAEHAHIAIEAAKIAYRHRDAMLGEPERSRVLLELLHDDPVEALATRIVPGRASCSVALHRPRAANTVYLTVVDRDRMVVSFINSIFHSFGSGICPPGSGVLLQNRGASFSLDPAHPNALGPGRRPMHTIIPAMLAEGSRITLSFGVMGGDYQPMGHAHVLAAIRDFGLDLQAACDAPRYVPADSVVQVEGGVSEAVRSKLMDWGHRIVPAPYPLGGAQIIGIDWEKGVLSAGSDPRKDGCALGY